MENLHCLWVERSYKQHIFTQKKVADVPGTAQRAGMPVVIAV